MGSGKKMLVEKLAIFLVVCLVLSPGTEAKQSNLSCRHLYDCFEPGKPCDYRTGSQHFCKCQNGKCLKLTGCGKERNCSSCNRDACEYGVEKGNRVRLCRWIQHNGKRGRCEKKSNSQKG